MFYYATVLTHVSFVCRYANYVLLHQALQAIGLFGLKLNRLPAAIGASLFFIW
jgi:hypothetical protein